MEPAPNKVNVVLDNVRSALNVGSFFRTADAAGINKLYLTGITAYPPHNKIPKTALGAIESVPWEYNKETADCIAQVKRDAPLTSFVAVELTDTAENYWDYPFKTDTTLIFGHELSGISTEFLEAAEHTVYIPMFGKKESLNVSVAFGIIIYEVLRKIRN